MKILQIVDTLDIGGAERMAVNIANALNDQNIVNVLVCSRRAGPLKDFLNNTTKLHVLHKKSSFDVKALFQFYKLIKNESPTHIHAHSSSIYWAVFIKLLFPKIILLWHDHNGNSELLKDNDLKFLKVISSKINGIIAVNNLLEEWSKRNMKCKHILYLENFPYLKVESSIKEKSTIICLANFRKQKDHFTLIKAAALLRERTASSFVLQLVGEDKNDDYSKNIKHLIETLQLKEHIKLLGIVPNVSELLSKASIGVLSSKSEGLPVSLLEYGLASLAVVVTDVGQCSQVLEQGKYGIIVSKENPEALAVALQELLENFDYRQKLANDFKLHVEQEYGSKKFLKNYLTFLNTLATN